MQHVTLAERLAVILVSGLCGVVGALAVGLLLDPTDIDWAGVLCTAVVGGPVGAATGWFVGREVRDLFDRRSGTRFVFAFLAAAVAGGMVGGGCFYALVAFLREALSGIGGG